MKYLTEFWDFVDQRGVMRRLVLGIAIYLTWKVTLWGMTYVEGSTRIGSDLAMIIGAVTLPVSTFAGFVFRSYLDSRAP